MAFNFNPDIHVVGLVFYSGLDSSARSMGGIVTDDPLVRELVALQKIDIQQLVAKGNDLIR